MYQCIFCIILLIAFADASMFSTKSMKGSTCLYDLETSLPFQFDRGELAERIMRSEGIHVTKHGIRFIPSIQHMRITWPVSFPCSNPKHGSICSIGNTSQVLPCSPDYVPKITGDGDILPSGYNEFLSSFDDTCRNIGEDAVGVREIVPSGHAYDLTQCNFHEGEISILYVVSTSTIYMIHGLELDSWLYIVSGFFIVLNVSCITQNIAHMINNSVREADVTLSIVVCIVCFGITVFSMDPRTLVTVEEEVAYWYMVVYASVRVVGLLMVFFESTLIVKYSTECLPLLNLLKIPHFQSKFDDHFYNLLSTTLQLMITRIHLSICTPYTIGIVLLIGIRLFRKLMDKKIPLHSNIVILFDAVLLQLICWAGVLPQFAGMTDAYASVLIILFVCIMGSRAIYILNPETFHHDAKNSQYSKL